ncbi:MAG: histidinol-phosphate transaminase [Lachnospiraceae bacterium]|nr:histidinol-phosphate transaminase [Lachnospiraceae bacterium]
MSWEDKVRRVVPYVAGEQPKERDIIKLNTNENPYPPSPQVLQAAKELETQMDRLRLYPDMNAAPLAEAIAQRYGASPEQVFVGVGSDDVLAMCFLTFFTGGGKLLFPDITYSFYPVWAQLFNIPYEEVPLDDQFRIRTEDYLNRGELAGIIFPNPNAPTSLAKPVAEIEQIAAGNPGCVVIIDEAYVDFAGESCLPLLAKYDNLLVVQTFSKSRTMAGLRIGYAIGSAKMIGYLKDVKFSFNSYTMNLPSIVLGTAQIRDDAYFLETCGRIVKTRTWFCGELSRLGFEYPEPSANFVFAKHPEKSGEALFKKLREKKIIVRRWSRPRIGEYLRITIGTDEQMRAVVKALEEILPGI